MQFRSTASALRTTAVERNASAKRTDQQRSCYSDGSIFYVLYDQPRRGKVGIQELGFEEDKNHMDTPYSELHRDNRRPSARMPYQVALANASAKASPSLELAKLRRAALELGLKTRWTMFECRACWPNFGKYNIWLQNSRIEAGKTRFKPLMKPIM